MRLIQMKLNMKFTSTQVLCKKDNKFHKEKHDMAGNWGADGINLLIIYPFCPYCSKLTFSSGRERRG